MTTIAANHQFIAADSKSVVGDLHHEVDKIYQIRDAWIGVAGEGRAMVDFIRWARKGMPKSYPQHEAIDTDYGAFQALILRRDGLYFCDMNYMPEKVKSPFLAVGTGAGPALGAFFRSRRLQIECSPYEAVEAACDADNNSGGAIVTYCVQDLPNPRQTKRTGRASKDK